MGFFNKMKTLTGSVPKELLQNGMLGRGIIVSIQQTSVSTGVDFDPARLRILLKTPIWFPPVRTPI